jgi:4-amino-4-deoxy-L-arabinose transferase-like glycosyltransferase
MTILGRLTAQPERALAYLCCAQIAFWTLAPALANSAPPLDVVEMYAWGREGVIATFKHPNLPGLILEATRRATGVAGWPAYFVSQIAIALTFWAVFALGRDLMDAKRALAGVALLTGVYFFSWTSPEFNHNVLQMPFWAAIALLLWRAVRDNKLWQWLALGLVSGFSLWAKYSSAVVLVPAAAWLLWDAEARKRLLSPGPYLALVAFIASAAPQALYLQQTHFAPLHYAERRSGDGGPIAAPAFLATMLAYHLPFLLLLLIAGMFGKAQADAPTRPEQRALRFLLLMGVGPFVLVLIGGLFGAGIRASWGAPMFDLSGLIAVALLSQRFSEARSRRLYASAGVLLVLIAGLYFGVMRFGAEFTHKPLKVNWPQVGLTRGLEQAWANETGNAPLRIVAGDIWTAGLVGMSDREPPSVLINGDLSISPWVTPQRLADEGALVVWKDGDTPPALAARGNGVISKLYVAYPSARRAPPLVLDYVILYPHPPGA